VEEAERETEYKEKRNSLRNRTGRQTGNGGSQREAENRGIG
jgi:hypothetical protein